MSILSPSPSPSHPLSNRKERQGRKGQPKQGKAKQQPTISLSGVRPLLQRLSLRSWRTLRLDTSVTCVRPAPQKKPGRSGSRVGSPQEVSQRCDFNDDRLKSSYFLFFPFFAFFVFLLAFFFFAFFFFGITSPPFRKTRYTSTTTPMT